MTETVNPRQAQRGAATTGRGIPAIPQGDIPTPVLREILRAMVERIEALERRNG